MANKRSPLAVAFLAILGLGGVAVAIVALGLGFTASSALQIDTAGRSAAAANLLEQRHAVASLLAAEQAAAVMDLIDDAGTMVSAPVTAQRRAASEYARSAVAALAGRSDSVGNEARRWLTAIDTPTDPLTVSDDFGRLVAYRELAGAACCAGIVTADAHRTSEMLYLETGALISATLWDHFYLAAEMASRTPPSQPPAVNQFLEYIGTPTALPPESKVPSEALAEALAPLADLGLSQSSLDSVLDGNSVATLDKIVLAASGRSTEVIPVDQAFVAVDAAARAVDELFTAALDETRASSLAEVETAADIRLVANVVTPLLLAAAIGVAIAIYLAARRRQRSLEHQQQLIDARNRFMRMVSHELRTPATAVSGFSQMLSSDWTSLTESEIGEFLRIVDRQSTHLALIVDDLLTLSHLETGRLRLHLGVADLAAAVGEAVAMVADRYDVDIATSVDPEITLLADPDRLVQILRNLVENAAKYGETGIEVTAARARGRCEILVIDGGPGVPPDAAETIFRFWDRGGIDDSGVRGHGMGLAIARHLARAMVGDLRYRPHQPNGSEFVLTLPFAVSIDDDVEPDTPPMAATG